jgi:uncharacterized protein YcbK (DUF882 family)
MVDQVGNTDHQSEGAKSLILPDGRRRAFMLGLGVASVPLLIGSGAQAAKRRQVARQTPAKKPGMRLLRLYNPNTKESWNGPYHNGTSILKPAQETLNWFLRDHHEKKEIAMDTGVLDMLWKLGERYRRAGHGRVAINVHSAFRTEKTNEKLRSEGAARNSLHKIGKAVDVSVQGYGVYFLIHHAERVRTGGLGYYHAAKFVHLDTGKRRYWYRRT